jgi:hypothetical protein
MQWFKHQSNARHDPFIFDLRRRFKGDGYLVYFGTLEIYADSFRPDPGWFLDVSFAYLKHELGIYHTGKLLGILDFIRSWPDVDRSGYRPRLSEDPQEIAKRLRGDSRQSFDHLPDIVPKWVVNLTKDRISLLIPNFLKIMDEYNRRRVRQILKMSGHTPDNVSLEPDEDKEKDKENPDPDIPTIFRDIAKDCEVLAEFDPVRGRRFPGSDFVGRCLREGYHPAAIRDGTGALIQQWDNASKQENFDPWAYALGTVRSRVQHYKNAPVDMRLVKTVFGGFFSGRPSGGR